jgi:ABC-type transporter Mla subunit MlaD
MIAMPNLDNQTIQLALVTAVALAMLLQAIVLLAVFIVIRKAARSMREDIEDLRSSVMPLVDNTRELFTRLAPKVEKTTDDLAALTHALREQTADVQSAATEIIDRARRQASRLDTLLSNVLDAVERAGSFMADTVAKPMRQLSAVLASAKAVVESLRTAEPAPRSRPNQTPDGNDMFV